MTTAPARPIHWRRVGVSRSHIDESTAPIAAGCALDRRRSGAAILMPVIATNRTIAGRARDPSTP